MRERQARRKAILDAARGVFFEKGLMAATVDEIAARSGLAKGTIYLYFRSKEEIYASLMVEGTLLLKGAMEKAVRPALSGERLLERLLKVYAGFYRRHPAYFRILFLSSHPDIQAKVSEEMAQRCIESGTMCLDVVAGVIRRGITAGEFRRVDPWGTAVILWAMVNGVILIYDQDPRHPEWIGLTLETLLKKGLDLSLRGIRAAAPSEKG
jgi:AcrR family transcriptional regulator